MTGPEAITDDHGLLSDASIEALELQHQPFNGAPIGGELFEDDITRETVANINKALYDNDDVLLVLGPPGSGRSTLLRQLASNNGSRIACFSVKGTPRFDTAHLFGSILQAFKAPIPSDLKDALDALIPSLQGTFERYNRLSTIVLDDADQVPVDELKKLVSSVLYLNGHEEPLLKILLSSTPDFDQRLPDTLPVGAEIKYATLPIEPFDSERTKSYLEFRLNQAGYFDELPFTHQDVQSILQESDAYPLGINEAAALNLNAQYDQLPESMLPPELVETRSSGTPVKMLLGGLACLMIVAGLFMFTRTEGERSPAARASGEYRTVETVDVNPDTSASAPVLELVDEPAANVVANQAVANQAQNQAADQTSEQGDSAEPDQSDANAAEAEAAAAAERAAQEAADEAIRQAQATAAAEAAAEAAAAAANTASDAANAPANSNTAAGNNQSTNSDDELLADAQSVEEPASSSDTPAEAESTAAPAATAVLESPTWILVQDPGRFTVQMSASTDRESIENFVRRNELPAPNSIFSFNRNGATWYALVHGLYEDIGEARVALRALPEGALRNQPWIRRVGQVQDSLKDQN